MPKRTLGPCTLVSIDPGTTSGLLVVSVDPRWMKGYGSASWEGLGSAVRFKAAYQVGRVPRRFDLDRDRSVKIDPGEGLDERMLPIMAANQPLMGDGEFDGRGRRDGAFYAILNGKASRVVGRGDLLTVDAGEILQVRQISGLLDNFADAALVIEDFVLRTQVSDREVLSSPRLRLAIETEEILHGGGRVPFLQQPSEMGGAPNDRLKRANLYFAGMEHATDAARHAAVFFRKARTDESIREAAWPRHFATGWEDETDDDDE